MEKKPVTVFFGTMTGNAEDLAERTAERLNTEGHESSLVSLDDYEPSDLANVQRAIVVISTWGEGDPPDECEDFCYSLYDGEVSDLQNMDYCVFALGDSSYDDFCGCGRKVDESLSQHGATCFMERKEVDVDFDDDFDEWLEALVSKLSE